MASSGLRKLIAGLGLLAAQAGMISDTTAADHHSAPEQRECLVLLHGLGRTRLSMNPIAKALKDEYRIINESYPSRKHTIENLAKLAIEPALDICKDAPKVHFVTHSLGGILVRQYLSEHRLETLGNVVMLGPPNQGSEIVDAFQRSAFMNAIYAAINGPAGQQLSTQADSKPISLGPVDFNLGVIAGNKNRNPIFRRIMPGTSDGKVTVERTKIEGMAHHLEMDVDHTWMMTNKTLIAQIRFFLKHGYFKASD